MTRWLSLVARPMLLALLTLGIAVPPVAASSPPINGIVSLVELCTQDVCGAAIFAGSFTGTVGNKPATGFVTVAVTFTSLPGTITGRDWSLQAAGHRFRGTVASGTIAGPGPVFTINAVLTVTQGGSGNLAFVGALDHTQFPPRVTGTITST